MFIPFAFHLPPIPRVKKVTFMKKKLGQNYSIFHRSKTWLCKSWRTGVYFLENKWYIDFLLKESTDGNFQNKSLLSAQYLNVGLLKGCIVLSALLEQLFSAWLWILVSALPQLCPVLRGEQGSPGTPVTCILHPWAHCWDFEFLKSVRLHWGFSSLSLSIFFSLLLCQSHTVWTSRFVSNLPLFCIVWGQGRG